MTPPVPRRPSSVSNYAEACLRALVEHRLARVISLGGALGLLHFWDYRPTHDVDAWWAEAATADLQQQVAHVIETTLAAFGEVKTRTWGDVTSIELRLKSRVAFSFQIARRLAQLEAPISAGWIDVPLDSWADLLASKMTALVERGAPRDFRDVDAVCQARLCTPAECWAVWRRRELLAGGDPDPERAALAIETHLARIAQHRRLEQIADPADRAEAERLRTWFAEDFLRARL